MADECHHPANRRTTAIRETWFEIITTVTCGCGATVSETRVEKIRPSEPGGGGKPPQPGDH